MHSFFGFVTVSPHGLRSLSTVPKRFEKAIAPGARIDAAGSNISNLRKCFDLPE